MATSILHFLFPPRCVSCKGKRDADAPLCTLCQGEYLREKQMSCRRCGQPMTRCQCRPRYDHHGVLCYLSVFRYKKTGCGGRMILTIKDRKDRRILELLAKDMASSLEAGCISDGEALVTFVPRRRDAVLQTGVDQAKMLARAVAKEKGLDFAPCLVATDGSIVQKDLDARARAECADEKYQLVKQLPPIAGRRVILVDDVLTTGATLRACAALLKEAGAGTVVCLTAGRG